MRRRGSSQGQAALTRQGSHGRFIRAGWSSPVARWAHNPKVVGSNPTPATKESSSYETSKNPIKSPLSPNRKWLLLNQPFFTEGLLCLMSSLSRRPSFRRMPSPTTWLLALRLESCHRPSIDVHRRLDGGVSHQLLLHLHGSACLVQPRAVGVAERMPPDAVRQADECRQPGAKLMLLEAFLVDRAFRSADWRRPNLHRLEYALKVRHSEAAVLQDADRAERSPLNIPSSPHLPFR